MSNYTDNNLISIPSSNVPAGTLAMKVGNNIFTAGNVVIGGSTDFYKCATVDTVNSTWTGYKAVLSGGVYSFESTVTSGLAYSDVTPIVNNVYADGALIRANLYQGWEAPDGAVFYAPLNASANAAVTGQSLTGAPAAYASYLGIVSAQFTGSEAIESANTNIPYSESPFSISLWVNIASNPSVDTGILTIGHDTFGALMSIAYTSTGIGLAGHGPNHGWDGAASVTFNGTWKHVVVIFGQGESGSRTASLYLDGTLARSGTFTYNPYAFQSYTPQFFIGSYWGNATYIPNLTGYMAALRIYNRELSASEITTLAAEFTPSAQ